MKGVAILGNKVGWDQRRQVTRQWSSIDSVGSWSSHRAEMLWRRQKLVFSRENGDGKEEVEGASRGTAKDCGSPW